MKKIIVLILGVFLLSGCMTSRFDISKPLASQDKSFIINDKGNLNYQNKIDISVKPCNFGNSASFLLFGNAIPARYLYNGDKAFYVEVGFNPKIDGFTFDPSSVVLKTDNFTLSPSQALGPLVKQEKYITHLLNFEETKRFLLRKDMEISPVSGSITLGANQWTGVLLKFNTYPSLPESNFTVSIKGLSNSGESVNVDVDFAHGYVYFVDDLQ